MLFSYRAVGWSVVYDFGISWSYLLVYGVWLVDILIENTSLKLPILIVLAWLLILKP